MIEDERLLDLERDLFPPAMGPRLLLGVLELVLEAALHVLVRGRAVAHRGAGLALDQGSASLSPSEGVRLEVERILPLLQQAQGDRLALRVLAGPVPAEALPSSRERPSVLSSASANAWRSRMSKCTWVMTISSASPDSVSRKATRVILAMDNLHRIW